MPRSPGRRPQPLWSRKVGAPRSSPRSERWARDGSPYPSGPTWRGAPPGLTPSCSSMPYGLGEPRCGPRARGSITKHQRSGAPGNAFSLLGPKMVGALYSGPQSEGKAWYWAEAEGRAIRMEENRDLQCLAIADQWDAQEGTEAALMPSLVE
ncbi:hypothetical protein NDU88_006335 [Pleurodeles waltl]|uniref:Uncharacterized protein n=1 Tax=Pleurodeles waltl TaxID=8319 RepID=A0AAV7N8C4_PLEWA|nr:hypothetical protein NDU88_006335 [Pleurodeles waltl]